MHRIKKNQLQSGHNFSTVLYACKTSKYNENKGIYIQHRDHSTTDFMLNVRNNSNLLRRWQFNKIFLGNNVTRISFALVYLAPRTHGRTVKQCVRVCTWYTHTSIVTVIKIM